LPFWRLMFELRMWGLPASVHVSSEIIFPEWLVWDLTYRHRITSKEIINCFFIEDRFIVQVIERV